MNKVTDVGDKASPDPCGPLILYLFVLFMIHGAQTQEMVELTSLVL